MHVRWISAALLMLLAGCATLTPMAFDKTAKSVDVGTRSIVLITLDVFRNDDSRYDLSPMVVSWETHDAVPNATPKYRITEKSDLVSAAGGHHEYALRMAIDPGRYQLMGVFGMASAFPFHGSFYVPLFVDVSVPPHSVVYAGHIAAQLRPRQDGEFRAGAMIPLIDQAATGMSGGTFDVTIEDAAATDVAMFRATFPALGDTPIATAVLPPFDRALVQRRLDGKD